MLRLSSLVSTVTCAGVLAAGLLLAQPTPADGMIQIQMTGVDIRYQGNTVVDKDPANAPKDPLASVILLSNSIQVGAPVYGATLDLWIPGLINIPATGGSVTSAVNGTLALDLGGGDFLNLTLTNATATYANVTPSINFFFLGSVSGITGQQLPYGITLADPTSVSFSTQVIGSVGHSGGVVTNLTAAGTGEIQGIPEPASLALIGLGTLLIARPRRTS